MRSKSSLPCDQIFAAAREKRARRAEPGGKLGSDDDVLRRDDIDAMGERGAAQIDVDERNDDPDAGKAEPDRHVFRPVRHHQGDDVAFAEALIERPAGEAMHAPGQFAIAETFAGGHQRRRVALRGRQLFDDGGEEALRIGGDRRGRLERAQPVAQRRVLAPALARLAFRLDQGHAP